MQRRSNSCFGIMPKLVVCSSRALASVFGTEPVYLVFGIWHMALNPCEKNVLTMSLHPPTMVAIRWGKNVPYVRPSEYISSSHIRLLLALNPDGAKTSSVNGKSMTMKHPLHSSHT